MKRSTSNRGMRSAMHPAFQRLYLGWLLLLLAWPGQFAESQAQIFPQPPQFLVQPTDLIVLSGSNASFTVVMHDSTAILTYIWRDFDANVLGGTFVGGTTNTLTLWHVEPTQVGAFSVVVTNVSGMVTSTIAYLTVVSDPWPWKQAVHPGEDVTFSVSVAYDPRSGPVDFQWHLNGMDLAGATGRSLTLTNVQTSGAGGYSCTVANAAGVVTTSEAVLSVWTRPRLHCLEWGSNGLGFQVSGSPGIIYVIQATQDFKEWIDLSTNTTPASGIFEFNDPDAFRFDWRWYRAFQP